MKISEWLEYSPHGTRGCNPLLYSQGLMRVSFVHAIALAVCTLSTSRLQAHSRAQEWLGLYPANPASGEYMITSPIVESAQIQVGRGKTFTITAKGVSDERKYITSARLNGKPLLKPFLSHAEMMRGGSLVLEMSEKPSGLWAE
jgi:Glycosyl hydrolase family 92